MLSGHREDTLNGMPGEDTLRGLLSLNSYRSRVAHVPINILAALASSSHLRIPDIIIASYNSSLLSASVKNSDRD